MRVGSRQRNFLTSNERCCADCGTALALPTRPLKKYCQTCHARRMKAVVLVSRHNKRAADVGIPGRISCEEWIHLCQQYNHICLRCGRAEPLTMDHVIPVCCDGSTNTIENVQPLCKPCNCTKSARSTDYRHEDASVQQLRWRVLAELGDIHPCQREQYALAWISPSGGIFRVEVRKHFFWLHMKGMPRAQIIYMRDLVTRIGAANISIEQRQALLALRQLFLQDHGSYESEEEE